jgi:hypothetical protein
MSPGREIHWVRDVWALSAGRQGRRQRDIVSRTGRPQMSVCPCPSVGQSAAWPIWHGLAGRGAPGRRDNRPGCGMIGHSPSAFSEHATHLIIRGYWETAAPVLSFVSEFDDTVTNPAAMIRRTPGIGVGVSTGRFYEDRAIQFAWRSGHPRTIVCVTFYFTTLSPRDWLTVSLIVAAQRPNAGCRDEIRPGDGIPGIEPAPGSFRNPDKYPNIPRSAAGP